MQTFTYSIIITLISNREVYNAVLLCRTNTSVYLYLRGYCDIMVLTGSPFVVNIGGKPSGRVRETITKEIEAASPTGPGVKCELQLKIPGRLTSKIPGRLTSKIPGRLTS